MEVQTVRRGMTALVAVACFGAATIVASAPAEAHTADSHGDFNWTRSEVEQAFLDEMVPALGTPIDWTGDVETCDAGRPSSAAQEATLTAVNFVRRLGQLDPVSFDPVYSAKAQEAALIMDANDALSHSPYDWDCTTEDGFEAAERSNLSLGRSGANAILLYMDDPGRANITVGHRRWIMRPWTATMGSGSTDSANALWVVGSSDNPNASVPEWVAWPTSGYFPSPLEPEGRWSLSASHPSVTFSGASVAVWDDAGTSLPVEVYPPESRYTQATLVWEVGDVEVPADHSSLTYTVRVSNIGLSDGTTMPPYEYSVSLFSPPFIKVAPPLISGDAKVGKTLTASPGTWAPQPSSYSYRWHRSGVEIPGADGRRYTVGASDLGETITVEVRVRRSGYARTSHVSAASSPVALGDPLQATSRPVIYGIPEVGRTLRVAPGRWRPRADRYAYRWFRDGTAIPLASRETYTLTRRDRGKRITARVIASKTGHQSGTSVTRPTVRVGSR